MPTKLSREEFLQNLKDTGLFQAGEIDTFLGPAAEDGEAFARRLIAAGKLTPFQAAAVRERHFEQLVIGNYQVLDRLGAGGMGTVYKARHRRMKRVVAVKVLSRAANVTEEFVQRFQREVEAVARLSHPNIVMAYDADEAEVGHFLVMEFVDGRDLATEVKQRGPLSVHAAVDCVVQAARGLAYAHGQGIIHRDVKPANLLRDAGGVVKVADLGLARISGAAQAAEPVSALTQAGTIMGTVDYMSPEQALGLAHIDQRTDIYSLGCTLYFLLAGRPPYEGPSIMAILLKHREGPIPSLGDARAGLPAGLEPIFRRMVAKNPADRFADLDEVVRALEAVPLPADEQPPPTPARPPAEVPTPTVNLQAAPAGDAPGQTVAFSLAGEPAPVSTTILLVEPSRTQAVIIRKYLQELGYPEVTTTPSGQQALASARAVPPRVVLSALHLPDMTGVQLAQQIRDELKGVAPGFVLISSEADSAGAGSLSKCGKAVILHKPFTPDQLAEALQLVSAEVSLERPAVGATVAGRTPHVLVVDDSASARLHVRKVLEGLFPVRVTEAADGAQAVAAVAKEPFDLVITDYNMPFLNGGDLVAYLKQNLSTAAVPVVMVTTEKDPGKLDAVRRLGVAAVCDKSFRPEDVRGLLESLVHTP